MEFLVEYSIIKIFDCYSPTMEGAKTPCCPATAPKPERSGEDLFGGVGQSPCCSVCKPGQASDLCNCKQRFLYQILSSIFILYQIFISCNKMEINYLKIIQCDFLDFFSECGYCWRTSDLLW